MIQFVSPGVPRDTFLWLAVCRSSERQREIVSKGERERKREGETSREIEKPRDRHREKLVGNLLEKQK